MDQFCIPYCLCDFIPNIKITPQSCETAVPKQAGTKSQCSSTDLSTIALKDTAMEASDASIVVAGEPENHQKSPTSSNFSAFWTKTSHNETCLGGLPCIFRQKALETQPKQESVEQQPTPQEPAKSKKASTKRLNSYSLRKDVIYKTIFRSIRKFFISDFRKFFDFTKCTKHLNSEASGELIAQIGSYISARFGHTQNSQRLGVLLLCIIDSKQRYWTIGPELQAMNREITSLLYSYNKRKLAQLLGAQEFLEIVLHFLSQADILDLTMKERKEQRLVKQYEKVLFELKTKCSVPVLS